MGAVAARTARSIATSSAHPHIVASSSSSPAPLRLQDGSAAPPPRLSAATNGSSDGSSLLGLRPRPCGSTLKNRTWRRRLHRSIGWGWEPHPTASARQSARLGMGAARTHPIVPRPLPTRPTHIYIPPTTQIDYPTAPGGGSPGPDQPPGYIFLMGALSSTLPAPDDLGRRWLPVFGWGHAFLAV